MSFVTYLYLILLTSDQIFEVIVAQEKFWKLNRGICEQVEHPRSAEFRNYITLQSQESTTTLSTGAHLTATAVKGNCTGRSNQLAVHIIRIHAGLEDEHTILLCLLSHAHLISFGARLPVSFILIRPCCFHHGYGSPCWDIGKQMAKILLGQLHTQHAKDAIPRNTAIFKT